MHILCTICSDLVNQTESIFVIKCGHIFHHHCLLQWTQRSKTCPQCRNKVTDKCMFRLYPTISNDITNDEDAAMLQSRLDDTLLQLRQEKSACKEKNDKIVSLESNIKNLEKTIKSNEKKIISSTSAVNALRDQVDYLNEQIRETLKWKEENESLKKQLELCNGMKTILNGTVEDVEQMLQGYSDVHTLAIFATALKRGLCESETKNREVRDKLHSIKQQTVILKKTNYDLQNKVTETQEKLYILKRKYQSVLKRKAVTGNEPVTEQPMPKQMRTTEPTLNETAHNETFDMVKKIENSDSPYFTLKQSSLALATLLKAHNCSIPVDKIKPSELALINSERNNASKSQNFENRPWTSQKMNSIFNTEPKYLDPVHENKSSQTNVSYDGLGGHSKLDVFPVPNSQPNKSLIPKLSSKHRLKKPTLTRNQDISKMFQK